MARSPATVAALAPVCAQETNGSLFSMLMLSGLREGEHEVEVVVENGAGRANLSLLVTAEEPIRGLRATPSPEARVLQGVLVVSWVPAPLRCGSPWRATRPQPGACLAAGTLGPVLGPG